MFRYLLYNKPTSNSSCDHTIPELPRKCLFYQRKTIKINFYISGGPPVGSFQEGKGMSSGDIISFNSDYAVNCDNSLLSRTNNYIFELSEFEDNYITCYIYNSSGRHQVISFHVSCSKRLVVDDSFGAINLNDYINSGGYSPCSMQYHNGETGM